MNHKWLMTMSRRNVDLLFTLVWRWRINSLRLKVIATNCQFFWTESLLIPMDHVNFVDCVPVVFAFSPKESKILWWNLNVQDLDIRLSDMCKSFHGHAHAHPHVTDFRPDKTTCRVPMVLEWIIYQNHWFNQTRNFWILKDLGPKTLNANLGP